MREDVEKGRLSRSRGAHDRHDLTWGDGASDRGENGLRSGGIGEVGELKGRRNVVGHKLCGLLGGKADGSEAAGDLRGPTDVPEDCGEAK